MAYRSELLETPAELAIGHAEAKASGEIRAYYAECKLCSCPKFVGGQNETHCGGCGHSKDDHRY
jgi:hypothetical protein